jgi:hypothetical protein
MPQAIIEERTVDSVSPPPDTTADATSPEELCDAICQLAGVLAATEAQLLKLLLAFDGRSLCAIDGAPSTEAWCTYRLGWSRRTANAYCALARSLGQLPALYGVLARGECTKDQVAPLAEVASTTTDEHLADEVPSLSARDAERLARLIARPTARDAATLHANRYLHTTWRDGMLRISGALDADDGALVDQVLRYLAEIAAPTPAPSPVSSSSSSDRAMTSRPPGADPAELGEREPYGARLADALVQCCSARAGDEPGRALLVVHCEPAVLHGQGGGALAEVPGGPVLAPATAQRLGCDGNLQLIADGPGGEVLSLGRITRMVPGWLRRRLVDRDRHCRFPGCERTRLLHAHHVVFWADGGVTDETNLILLCHFHHHLVHEGGFRLTGEPGGPIVVERPDGSTISGSSPSLRPEVRARLFGDNDHPPGPPEMITAQAAPV